MKKLDKKSAAVFTNLLKEKSYAYSEARSMLLGKKGTGKTTVTRTTHGGEKTRQKICSCVHKTTKRKKVTPTLKHVICYCVKRELEKRQ